MEVVFFGFVVVVSVLSGFFDSLFGNVNSIFVVVIVVFGCFENFFVMGVGGNVFFDV